MIRNRVLVLDIETSPLIVMVWELGKNYVTKDQVLEDFRIMSFSAKWLGDPPSKLVYMEARDRNDLPLLQKLHELFNQAEIVVTQNGKKFDEPKIKARMMLHGLQPYKPFKHHDTYTENLDKAFTSHSLDYLTDKFCTKYKKLKHKNFPGLSLWKACLGIKLQYNPNPKAWAEMRKYNNHDVLSDEELYLKTRGWATKKAPALYWEKDPSRRCKYCGEFRLKKDGFDRTAKKVFHYTQCSACGKYQRGAEVKEAA